MRLKQFESLRRIAINMKWSKSLQEGEARLIDLLEWLAAYEARVVYSAT